MEAVNYMKNRINDLGVSLEEKLKELDPLAIKRILSSSDSYEELLVVLQERADDFRDFDSEMGEEEDKEISGLRAKFDGIASKFSSSFVGQIVKTVGNAVIGTFKIAGKLVSFTAILLTKVLFVRSTTAKAEWEMYKVAVKSLFVEQVPADLETDVEGVLREVFSKNPETEVDDSIIEAVHEKLIDAGYEVCFGAVKASYIRVSAEGELSLEELSAKIQEIVYIEEVRYHNEKYKNSTDKIIHNAISKVYEEVASYNSEILFAKVMYSLGEIVGMTKAERVKTYAKYL